MTPNEAGLYIDAHSKPDEEAKKQETMDRLRSKAAKMRKQGYNVL